MTTLNQIKEVLKANNVSFQSVYLGLFEDDNGWEHYSFTVLINGQSFPYKKGTGHSWRSSTYRLFGGTKKLAARKLSVPEEYIIKDYTHTFIAKPMECEVIYSLLMDSFTCGDSFRDFCDTLGYDTDSRKALDLYLKTQEQTDNFKGIFNSEIIAEFERILEDY